MNDASHARRIDPTVVGITLAAVVWTVVHLWSVLAHPWDEPQSAWMIWPLAVGLCICAPFVLYTAWGAPGVKLSPDGPGLNDPTRLRFVISTAAMVAGIWAIGLVATAVIGPPAMAFALGERRAVPLAVTATLPAAILLGLFVWALSVRLPLLPGWM